jgi:hypothetical protein
MFYWETGSIARAANLYFEWRAEGGSGARPSMTVPVGIAAFPKEPARCPRDWLPSTINIIRWTEMPAGATSSPSNNHNSSSKTYACSSPASTTVDPRSTYRRWLRNASTPPHAPAPSEFADAFTSGAAVIRRTNHAGRR